MGCRVLQERLIIGGIGDMDPPVSVPAQNMQLRSQRAGAKTRIDELAQSRPRSRRWATIEAKVRLDRRHSSDQSSEMSSVNERFIGIANQECRPLRDDYTAEKEFVVESNEKLPFSVCVHYDRMYSWRAPC